MRLFVAIALTDEIREAFRAFLNTLRGAAPNAKWVRPENLHVTLKFLGHTDAEKLPAIHSELAHIHDERPISLTFGGLGFFPNDRRPRVFWVGMDASVNLKTMAGGIDREMHKLGFPLETRPFTPHLTLARFEPPGMPAALADVAQQNSAHNFGALTAPHFRLIESKLKPTGAEYTTLQSFPFVTGT